MRGKGQATQVRTAGGVDSPPAGQLDGGKDRETPECVHTLYLIGEHTVHTHPSLVVLEPSHVRMHMWTAGTYGYMQPLLEMLGNAGDFLHPPRWSGRIGRWMRLIRRHP